MDRLPNGNIYPSDKARGSRYDFCMAKKKVLALVAEIAAVMERQGVTRNALAVRAGVPAATVTRILAGDRPDPQLSTVVKLAEALGLRVGLVEGKEKKVGGEK